VPSSEPSGTYGVYDAALTAAYARRAGSFDLGVGLSYVHERIYLASASALECDLGARWHRGNLTAAAALRNLGVSTAMRSARVPLPWDARIGLRYDVPLFGTRLSTLADARYAPDFAETFHVGLQVVVTSALAVRVGYDESALNNPDDIGLTAGLGLRYGRLGLDYAYIPERDGLGSAHVVTLAVRQ
jgi:hypothetical protein